MKIRHAVSNILLPAALILLAMIPPLATSGNDHTTIPPVIRIATSAWPPHINNSPTNPGDIRKTVDRVFTEMGISLEYHYYPWERCLLLTLNGTVDASYPYYSTPRRQRDFLVSKPIYTLRETLLFFSRNGNIPNIRTIEDLKKYRVGGIVGYAHLEYLKNYDIPLYYANNEIEALCMLKTGEIDIVPMESDNARTLIATHFPSEKDFFGMTPSPLENARLYLLISPKHEYSSQLLEKFNAILTESSHGSTP